MNKRLYPNQRQLRSALGAVVLISSMFLYILWVPTPVAWYVGWIGFACTWLVALMVAFKKRKKLYSYYCSAKGFERVDLFGKRMKLILFCQCSATQDMQKLQLDSRNRKCGDMPDGIIHHFFCFTGKS